MVVDYAEFLDRKSQIGRNSGFDPVWVPDWLKDFQRHLVSWSIVKGRAAILANCGLGKTPMQLVWAENVLRKTGKRVLVLTPLAVASQTKEEADKFGIDAEHSKDGKFSSGIVIANYDRLHHFDSNDFGAVVCDEAGILKSVDGVTRKQVTRFMSKLKYRLLCTATPAPNDYTELGNLSEALGDVSHSDMLKRFFRQLDDKGQKQELKQQEAAEKLLATDANYYKKLAYRVAQTIGQWRLKHHAITPFWRWVASWAMACRNPSDLGFDDGEFKLPPMEEHDHLIEADSPPPGMLFNMPAVGLSGEREERNRTLTQRCEYVAKLVDHAEPSAIWCQANNEGDLLEKIIPGARQIAGRTPDEEKIELYDAFRSGQLKKLIIKPKIGAWGLNWQHCAHVVTFATHSYEQYYKLFRRCWRFGQKKTVRLDTIATEGEIRVMGNLRKKAERADNMFLAMVAEMRNATSVTIESGKTKMEVPSWLSKIS